MALFDRSSVAPDSDRVGMGRAKILSRAEILCLCDGDLELCGRC